MDPPNKKSSQSRQFSLQALALGWLWVASPGLSPSLAPTSSAFLRNDTAKGGLPSAFICPNPSSLRSSVHPPQPCYGGWAIQSRPATRLPSLLSVRRPACPHSLPRLECSLSALTGERVRARCRIAFRGRHGNLDAIHQQQIEFVIARFPAHSQKAGAQFVHGSSHGLRRQCGDQCSTLLGNR